MAFTELLARIWRYLLSLVWHYELELAVIGLQNAGKTSLLSAITGQSFDGDTVPTLGYQVQHLKINNTMVRCWDMGGQSRFRKLWELYCRDSDVIIFVFDAADPILIPTAREELKSILSKQSLAGIPVLVLANKNDLADASTCKNTVDIIDAMKLDEVIENEADSQSPRQISCFSISVKSGDNIEQVLEWLLSVAQKKHHTRS